MLDENAFLEARKAYVKALPRERRTNSLRIAITTYLEHASKDSDNA